MALNSRDVTQVIDGNPVDFSYASTPPPVINDSKQKELFQACLDGDVELVRSILSNATVNKVHVNAKYNRDKHGKIGGLTLLWNGWTCLTFSAFNGHAQVVEVLLSGELNAKINQQDHNGQTPLYWAAVNGHLAVVRLLVEQGQADLEVKDNMGWTTLMRAVYMNKYEVVECLLQRGANPNAKDNDGKLVLSFSQDGRMKALLKKHGAK